MKIYISTLYVKYKYLRKILQTKITNKPSQRIKQHLTRSLNVYNLQLPL